MTARRRTAMNWRWMTEEFVGCWWCCGVEAPAVHPVGAGGGGGV